MLVWVCGRRVGDSSVVLCLCICILWYVWLFAHRRKKPNESVVPVFEVSCFITCIFCHLMNLQPFEALTETAVCLISHFQCKSAQYRIYFLSGWPSSVEDFEGWSMYTQTLAFIHSFAYTVFVFVLQEFETGRAYGLVFQLIPLRFKHHM